MATSAKRRAMYASAGVNTANVSPSMSQPSSALGAAVFAGGRSHAVSGATAGAEAAAAQNQQYIVYAVVGIGVVGALFLLIKAWRG